MFTLSIRDRRIEMMCMSKYFDSVLECSRFLPAKMSKKSSRCMILKLDAKSFLFVCLEFIFPLDNFLLIWRRHHRQ